MTTSRTVRLADYTPPAYTIDAVDLEFELGEEFTTVSSQLQVRRSHGTDAAPLRLDGENLELVSVRLDGEVLPENAYKVDAEGLTIPEVSERFQLEIVTRIRPQENTSLQGLYTSGGMFCTQCEAEGFRHITYYLDRPDVLARFRTRIVADKTRYPVLLSNGNCIGRGELDDGRLWVQWEDPFPKPAYLFALVAGDLACREDTYTTASGREVKLEIYVRPEDLDQTAHALEALKHSMRWDEETYGLEYDLDVYMIVAVGDFNMGAMENKGLNIFNTQYVLATPDTATDNDFENVVAVIGHEYFHNWTGNRVTLRDWFQLSLKEGLTVFREQQFSAAMGSAAVKRIEDVRILRSHQFPEDAGPMAHPVRPEEYVEINNFYTPTVYNKGAEVIRMYHSLLGTDGFRRGLDLYFQRHDGQAVTVEDFKSAMEDANGRDLTQFGRWYSQAGTPVVEARDNYDAAQQRYTLTLRQSCPPTPGQRDKASFHIPVAMGLLGTDGAPLPLRLEGEAAAADATTRVLELTEREQQFVFTDVPERPVPSLLRDFSAPVKLDYPYDDEQLAFLFANDEDPFNRWEAGQRLLVKLLMSWIAAGRAGALPESVVEAFTKTLADERLDRAFVAEALSLPAESYLAEQFEQVDPVLVHEMRETLRLALRDALREQWEACYHANNTNEPYALTDEAIGRRALKNLCLHYLLTKDGNELLSLAEAQYRKADNMTDRLAALSLLADFDTPTSARALEDFYQRYRDHALVVDKWFRVQAMSRRGDALERARELTQHPAFELRNPNRVRALVGAFCQGNPAQFHAADGSGYAFLADHVIALNALNPQVAARMVTPLSRWRRLDAPRQTLMRQELERVAQTPGLSKDVSEIVSRSLNEHD